MNTEKNNVLIVEDDGIIANRLFDTMTDQGYGACILADGEEAVGRINRCPEEFSIVLMDIRLKGEIDGVEAARRIRLVSDIPIVFLTAYSDDELIERAEVTEPYGYLIKPFRPRELIATLKIAVYKYNLERERRDMAERIQNIRKRESLGLLAGAVSHHFNNLLSIVIGNAEMIADDADPESAVGDMAEEIRLAGLKGTEIIKQILKYTGISAGETEEIHIGSLVREMVPMIGITVPKEIRIIYDTDEDMEPVTFDSSHMRQIVMELVGNAAEALEDMEPFSGTIRITTGMMKADKPFSAETPPDTLMPEGLYAFMEVTDNGCGIDPEIREKIFDPFFSTKFFGRGMGLAAVLGMIKRRGCAIMISGGPGEGTGVRVLFPVERQKK